MKHFQYSVTVPKEKEYDLFINLLLENLALTQALIVQLGVLSRADIAKNPEEFVRIIHETMEESLIQIVAEIEKKYGA